MNNIMPTITTDFYFAASPIFVLCIGAVVAMLFSAHSKLSHAKMGELIVYLTLAAAGTLLPFVSKGETTLFLDGAYLSDQVFGFSRLVVIYVALLVALMVSASSLRKQFFRPEMASIYLIVVCGLLVLVSSMDLISIFIGLEMSSIGLYALVGYIVITPKSQEGAMKYFVLGSVSVAFLLFGFALAYAATGSLNISEIFSSAKNLSGSAQQLMSLGVIFIVVGLGFKFALAPFHIWAPDAYESAPTAITAFMATAAKAAILLLLLRVIMESRFLMNELWRPSLTLLALASIMLGNIMALAQASLKRMLAYSSIAHSGYMAIGMAALGGSDDLFTNKAILFYILFYTVISIGAFAIIQFLESEKTQNIQLQDLAGLAKKQPWAAFGLAVFMFSFAGLPPSVGFMSKLFIFKAALSQGMIFLVLVGVLGSAISLYYYLRVIVFMYMKPAQEVSIITTHRSPVLFVLAGVMVILTLVFGTIAPSLGLERMKEYVIAVGP